jgi:hypothetical protein
MGFSSLYPRYRGGRPPKFTLPQRREIKKIAKSRPAEHGLPFPPGAWPSWASSWWLRGWSMTSAMRACGSCSARKASLSAAENLEDLCRPRLRGQESPGRAPVRDRRPRGHSRAWRPKGDLLPGRIRAAEPPASPGPAVGRGQQQRTKNQTASPGTPVACFDAGVGGSGDRQSVQGKWRLARSGRVRPRRRGRRWPQSARPSSRGCACFASVWWLATGRRRARRPSRSGRSAGSPAHDRHAWCPGRRARDLR